MQVKRIITHRAPHIDEILAIWLLRRFGEDEFPGVASAPVGYWQPSMASQPWQSHHEAGDLLIGVGGGRFDEHPSQGKERKEGHAAASLVATALGVIDDKALEPLLKFVVNNDLNGSSDAFDLGSLVVLLHRCHPEDPDFVIQWASTVFKARYEENLKFLTATKDEFEQNASVKTFKSRNGRKLKLVYIKSDNQQMVSFARSKHGGYAAIVIIQNSGGNTCIFTNKFYRLRLKDVAKTIRIEEQKANGEIHTWKWNELEAEGVVAGAEEWYYFTAGEMLLNGSPTHPDVQPTNLALDRIVELVSTALSPDFEPSRREHCLSGNCTSTNQNPCPWYAWGLSRCGAVRRASRNS